ncbi:sensor domain-containing phosphodiesterase [Cellulomonas carbonis]|nr:EAL domain-containing protein [Cellulomonas carbonis]GGC00366.1 hypothetical protein GCM10010972_11390 [Cellulomonas carbonis]
MPGEAFAGVPAAAGPRRSQARAATEPPEPPEDGFGPSVQRLLRLLRTTVGMKIAWTSEFLGSEQVFRFVDAAPDAGAGVPRPGTALPLSGAYCSRVIDGTMPAAITDTSTDPSAVLLPVTFDMHIGSYLGVPLRSADGAVEGMLCAVSPSSSPSLSDADVTSARLIADVIDDIHRRELAAVAARRRRDALRRLVRRLCRGTGRQLVVQAIVDLMSGEEVGVEALTRFDDVERSPAEWFATAQSLGLGTALEVAAAASALRSVPADATHALSINLSPEAILDGALDELLGGRDHRGVIVEVTEHAPIASYEALEDALRPHRERGVRIAVDDVGAGYASMTHVLRLRPDLVKIDMSLVHGLDGDPVRRALVSAITGLAEQIGADVVAEGVETTGEREALVGLGVRLGQGYLFQRPTPVPTAA